MTSAVGCSVWSDRSFSRYAARPPAELSVDQGEQALVRGCIPGHECAQVLSGFPDRRSIRLWHHDHERIACRGVLSARVLGSKPGLSAHADSPARQDRTSRSTSPNKGQGDDPIQQEPRVGSPVSGTRACREEMGQCLSRASFAADFFVVSFAGSRGSFFCGDTRGYTARSFLTPFTNGAVHHEAVISHRGGSGA